MKTAIKAIGYVLLMLGMVVAIFLGLGMDRLPLEFWIIVVGIMLLGVITRLISLVDRWLRRR